MPVRRAVAGAVMLATIACGSESSGPIFRPSDNTDVAVLVGAGDIGECGPGTAPEQTARILDRVEGVVFTAGDNAYPRGTNSDFRNCYEPSWGRHKGRTRPTPGNHDMESPGAGPYFNYFGANAGPPGQGYYSYTAGTWTIYALNSSLPIDRSSIQMQWLQQELEMTGSRCSAAIFHHPPFSSGPHGEHPYLRDLWRTLYAARVDVVIAAHDHLYERFGAMDADGRAEPGRGMRQFVVGTGGARLVPFVRVAPNSEMRISDFGVLRLTLQGGGYRWDFLQANGNIGDTGADICR